MPYCSRCGVEVAEYIEECPLCQTPIQNLEVNGEKKKGKFPLSYIKEAQQGISKKQKIYLTWGIISLLLFIPICVILAIRFLYSDFFTWEGYTLVPLGAGWIYFSLLLFFIKRIKIIIIGFYINSNVFLFFIDVLNGDINWYLTIGLPILTIFSLLLVFLIIVIFRVKRKGTNIIAFILSAISLFCLGVDFIISFGLKWSLIVTIALLPLILFFLYFHYILKIKIDWGKKFHV